MEELEKLTDGELLQRSVRGDERAFLVLYGRLKMGIFRYAFYMTGSRTAAEEVTQETFLCLLKGAARYKSELGDLGAFAFGIARNLVRRSERWERKHETFPGDDGLEKLSASLLPNSDALDGAMIRNEVVERVQEAVGSLPDHYRQVVVLCDLCELSYAEAATRLQCAVGTVRSRLNRAHGLLAQKLTALKSRKANLGTAGSEGCLV
jgi:RNA polymerase sigma-70 factor, ECF subfamily